MRPGTLRWAVPEHFSTDVEQTTQLTTQSDIYSFGIWGSWQAQFHALRMDSHPFPGIVWRPPWSEIQHEAAVVLQLSRGKKPKRPSSRPIEDKHWELIDRCWSSVGHRPCAGDMVSSLQQFLYTFPTPLPLVDLFRVSSSSTHPAEQNASEPEPNVQHRSQSEITLDHQSVMLRDGKYMLPTPGPITSPPTFQTQTLHVASRRRRVLEREPYASVGGDENYRTNSKQKARDLDNITIQQQSRRISLRISSNRRGGDNKDAKTVGASKGAEHRQIPRSLTVPQARHVIFMGETGSGKSSIINLFADHNHAAVSPDSSPCTSHFVSYEVSVEGRTYRLWDTPGLTATAGSRFLGRFSQTAESSLERFLQERRRRGELDLFVLCIGAGRVSTETSRIYKMFWRTNRQTAIPAVIAVTHLEEVKPTMDTRWHSHERELAKRGMVFDGHACLTCLSPHELRGASQQAIRDLISSEYQPRALSALAKEDYLNNPSRRSCTIC
ncbi:hypothetical protein JVT61DRAFT_11830 [Boletus reticuloceps]|uniref:G domain-containing protein n=1 Tax=Boletus reticuloceps TaxID=495285 RepID=A0A8I2YY78_9AGAM|nr:hypothetical protein JVT61DRAFT_11830 [Boletus reticuloceps]